ncbi:MAG: hypothetical protein ACK5L5_07225 [Bacteroidales bacterium]
MKHLKLAVITLAAVLSFQSCSKDEDDSSYLSLSEDSLSQTQWEGVLQYKDTTKKKSDIIIIFESSTYGYYLLNNSDDIKSIEYKIEGKRIYINRELYDLTLWGYWWVEKSEKEELKLNRDPHTKDEATLTLHRVY